MTAPDGAGRFTAMAVLRAPDQPPFIVPARCLIGRSRACDLVLAARDVSSQHAVLQWAGDRWELQDLGSRNGTFVDDVRIAPGAKVPAPAGATIRCGREASWTLADAGGPQLVAVEVNTGEARTAEGGYLALPDPQEPALSVYQDPQGAWVCERAGEVAAIDDRALVAVGDALWRIHVPTASQGTWQDDDVVHTVDVRLRLGYSRDEEYVEAIAFAGERRLDLQVRAHHYVLLVLARRRLAHQAAGLPELEQGWIRQDELLKMLKMDENHLNISIHRARTQLGKHGIADAASLVERRTGTRQLRIGVRAIELALLEDPRPATKQG